MTFKRSCTRHLLLILALLGASLATQATPIVNLTVHFDSVTPGPTSSAPGVFSFQFAGAGAEFTGLDCVTCTVTGIDWQQTPEPLWNSPTQVTAFNAVFSTGGDLVSFFLNLRQDNTTPFAAPDGNTYPVGEVFVASIVWDGAQGTTNGGGFLNPPPLCKSDINTGEAFCVPGREVRFRAVPHTFDRVVVTPEPATPALLGLGLLAVGAARRRRG